MSTSPSISFGGAFLRARDPQALYAWYEEHLGLQREHGAFSFPASTLRSPSLLCFFPQQDDYFPPAQPAMLNLQVSDLDALLDRLLSQGVTVDPKREDYGFGRFGWFTDLEGNRVEVWQPA